MRRQRLTGEGARVSSARNQPPVHGDSMNVLVLNAGSSSLKFQLIQTSAEQIATDADVRLARGIIERIGGHALLTLEVTGETAAESASPTIATWASASTGQAEGRPGKARARPATTE